MSPGLIKAGLEALYYSGAHTLMSPLCQGVGAIFTLHRVCPAREGAFQPNRILEVTPEFLDAVIECAKSHNYDIVSLDEAYRRLNEPGNNRPFICFTLDDGYRDNLEYAYPVFTRHGAPFAIYVPTAFPDGEGELWWVALERVIRNNAEIAFTINARTSVFQTGDDKARQRAFDEIYWILRKANEKTQRASMRTLCQRYGLDLKALCRELIMTWDEIGALNADPLVTIGAHTVNHYALAKLGRNQAVREMRASADMLESKLGARPDHFSFPYGDEGSAGAREFAIAHGLGFKTAVTTRKGVLYAEHGDHLCALPRVSLSGEYQCLRYIDVFLSGLPFVLINGLNKLNVA